LSFHTRLADSEVQDFALYAH